MRIFVIPSWYPSKSNPIYGTFIAEQMTILAIHRPQWKVGISIWGQGEEEYLLYGREPFLSLKKWIYSSRKESEVIVSQNLKTYKTPAFTWTKRVAKGNLRGQNRSNLKNLQRFIKDEGQPDFLLVQGSWPAASFAQSIWDKFRIPYIIVERMSPFPFTEWLNNSGGLKEPLAQAYKRASRVIATSQSVKKRMSEFGIDSIVVHNLVDFDLFYPSPDPIPLSNCLAIGRLVHQKGFDLLLEAFSRLKDFEWKLTFIGDGEDKRKLKGLAIKFGISAHVNFLGDIGRDQLPDIIRKHGSLILSSRHETFGNVLVEAMACGLPVVATKCGGPEDIVTESTGILCSPNNSQDLTQAIKKLWLKNWDRDKIRDHIIKNFSPENYVTKMEDVFQNLTDTSTISF